MNTSIVVNIFILAVCAVICTRSISYALFEWKENKPGSCMVILLTGLVAFLGINTVFF